MWEVRSAVLCVITTVTRNDAQVYWDFLHWFVSSDRRCLTKTTCWACLPILSEQSKQVRCSDSMTCLCLSNALLNFLLLTSYSLLKKSPNWSRKLVEALLSTEYFGCHSSTVTAPAEKPLYPRSCFSLKNLTIHGAPFPHLQSSILRKSLT